MNPETPSNFMSFMDYLGLNEESLRELEDNAAARAAQLDDEAANALGSAYQQAQGDMASGGQGNLSQQTSYLDYVRSRRQADEAAMVPTTGVSPAELAARQAMREGAPMQRANFAGREAAMRESLGRDAEGFRASKQAVGEFQKRQQAEREASQRAFDEARGRLVARTEEEERDLLDYSTGLGREGGRQGDLVGRFGSVGGARNALRARGRLLNRPAFAGAKPYELNTLNARR